MRYLFGGPWWAAKLLLVVVLVALLLWLAALFAALRAAPAEDGCGTPAELLGYLAGVHDERLVGIGQGPTGGPALLTMGEAGTWTLILAMPDGRACMAAAGVRAQPQPVGDRS